MTRFAAPAPLVAAVAPVGYGKTVAMAQWARATRSGGVWLRVPDGASSGPAFVTCVASSLEDYGLIDESNPLWAAEGLPFVDDVWELLTRGIRRISGPVSLALDEADLLDDETQRGLLRVLRDVPELSLRATVRRRCALTEPALTLDLADSPITAGELALRPDEADALLDDPAQVSETLLAGGAPAIARVLALGASTAQDIGGEDAVRAAARSLFRIRGAAWDEELADFVMRACLPDGIDDAFAAELTGRPDAATLLERAEQEGLGAWTQPMPRASTARFVFSPIIRYAAQQEIIARVGPTARHALTRRIALWERAEGNPFPALRRAVECADWALANDIVRESWLDLLRYGAQVRMLFRQVPSMTLRSWPLIAMLLAIIANARPQTRLRALEYFALALYGARTQRAKASPSDRALLRTSESVAQRLSGNLAGAARAARDAYDVLRTMELPARDRLGRSEPMLCMHLGVSFFYADDMDTALDCFRHALASYDARGSLGGAVAQGLVAGVMATAGDVRQAASVVADAADRRWPEGARDGYSGTFFHLARAVFALEDADPDAASAALRILDPTMPANEHWPLLTHAEVIVLLMRHRPEEALLVLEEAIRTQRSRHAVHTVPQARLRHSRALAELARGDAVAAEQALAKSAEGPRTAIGRARIALAEGDPLRALRSLPEYEPQAMPNRLRAEHLALRAAAAAQCRPGDADALIDPLRVLLEDRGMLLPLALLPASSLDALARASAGTPLAARVERARALALIPDAGTIRPRLTARELAVARELARHETVAKLAEALVVSPNTVKSQLRSLYRKLGVRDRAEAVQALVLLGITAR
ncbi:MAG: LuxR C-terminal-related transcriptional regulator [Microbacterium sp.]